MPKVVDAFTFFNENDVLAIRLEELHQVVDKFWIVTGDTTFRGEPKPDYLDYKRFYKYKEKIEIVKVKLPKVGSPWDREIAQRNAIVTSTSSYMNPEDTLIISDVDEIPRRSVVRPVDDEHRLILDKFSYSINMLTDEGNSAVRMLPYGLIGNRTAEQIRRSTYNDILVPNAGWEFSSLGTPEKIYLKFKSFAHSEFDHFISPEYFEERIRNGEDLLQRGITMKPVEIDDTWPEAIKNNRDYWRDYEWISD